VAVLLLAVALPCFAQDVDVDELVRKGQKQVQAGRLELAYDTFKKILVVEPRNSTAMNALAQIATFMKLPDEAVLFYTAYLHVGDDYLSIQDGELSPEVQEILKAKQKQESLISKAATLTIRTTPNEADVLINGLPVSRGEITVKVAPGKALAVSVSAEDYTPAEENVVLQPTENKNLQISLKKIVYKGKLMTKVRPTDGVKVFVDAKPAGAAGSEIDLTEGRHLVCFKKEGFDRWWRYVEVTRNDTVVLEANLREASRPDEPCDVLWKED
jgi:hypothetical protein